MLSSASVTHGHAAGTSHALATIIGTRDSSLREPAAVLAVDTVDAVSGAALLAPY
jgi:hypothetical protein